MLLCNGDYGKDRKQAKRNLPMINVLYL